MELTARAKASTLADKLGDTAHVSILLRKVCAMSSIDEKSGRPSFLSELLDERIAQLIIAEAR